MNNSCQEGFEASPMEFTVELQTLSGVSLEAAWAEKQSTSDYRQRKERLNS